ncbi:MAG: c-type cytochrome domain-containing protein [Bacteroidota bacterium]
MDFTTFFGRLHPLVVHLPIGFLLLGGIFYFLGKKEKYTALNKTLPITFLLSALSSTAAAFFGWLLAGNGGYDSSTLFWHKWLGIGVAMLSFLFFFWSARERKMPAWSIVLVLGLLGLVGHLGGSLTHGADYLTQPLLGEKKAEKTRLFTQPDSVDVYAHLIQPVLEKKCFACHNDNKQNGGLNMSNWEGMTKGGDGGKIIAHHVYDSELFKRVTLPQTSKKFMPPKGEPLTFGEINILKWWLENGAKPEVKLTSLKLNKEIKETLLHDYHLETDPKPFVETVKIKKLPDVVFSELKNAGWRVNELAQTSFLLEVSPANKNTVDTKNIEALLNAKEYVTWLNLGNSTVSDNDLKIIAQLTNLSRLRLENTQISDVGLEHLTALNNLESLNLFGNKITDAGLVLLKEMPALQKVYLWKTKTSDEGRNALRISNSNLQLL